MTDSEVFADVSQAPTGAVTASGDAGSGGDATAANGGNGSSPGFDFARHERVQKLRRSGLWSNMGSKFGGLHVRLVPFWEQSVVVRREQEEQAVRAQLTLTDDDPIPAEKAIAINKAAVHEALVGARGRVLGTPEMLRMARQAGLHIDGQWITFSGDETKKTVQALFWPVIDGSMPFLSTLAQLSKGLHTVDDGVLDDLGEDFVYGARGAAA